MKTLIAIIVGLAFATPAIAAPIAYDDDEGGDKKAKKVKKAPKKVVKKAVKKVKKDED
jgi:hypothetical protein